MNLRVVGVLVAFGLSNGACGLRESPVVPRGDSGVAATGTGGEGGQGRSGPGGMSTTPVVLGTGGANTLRPPSDAGLDTALVLDAPMDQGSGPAMATGGTGGSTGPFGLGIVCSAGSDCASGACVDGVCCESACAGRCSQCNLKNFEGRCVPVPAGATAPATHPACVKVPGTTCKENGACDGNGACALYASGESCGAGACNAITQRAVTGSTCDGLGTCKPPAEIPCAPFNCRADGLACASTCATDADCQGQPCVGGSCGKVGNGSKCTGGVQCTSGNCVDGFCCDLACAGSCQACDLTGSIGKCAALSAGQAPRNGRAACVAGVCGSRCDGVSASCTFASSTVACGAAKCVDGTVTASVSCDGKGACPAAPVTSCGGFGCAENGCKITCSTDADCASSAPYCSSGKCQVARPIGRACVAGAECGSKNCVNGVCCSTASCGACQACNLATPGTCSAKPLGSVDSGCASTCQTGTCDGTGACGNKSATSSCGPAQSCSASVLHPAAMCNGSGTCVTPAPTACANGCSGSGCLTCPASVSACNGTCCAAGQGCCAGSCQSLATTTNCGSCGHDCTVLPNLKVGAAVTCSGSGGCVVPTGTSACSPGFANCVASTNDANGCETPTTSNANCGGCGVACTFPTGVASCSTGTCVKSCGTGAHSCGNSCASDNDTTQCASSATTCIDCTQPNATAHCGSPCSNTCVGVTLCSGVGGKPSCGAWDFDQSTTDTQGWVNTSSRFVPDASNGVFGVSGAQHFTGTRALSIGHNVTSISVLSGSTTLVDLCPSSAGQLVNLGGRTFSMMVLIDPTPNANCVAPPPRGTCDPTTTNCGCDDLLLGFNSDMFLAVHNGINHGTDASTDNQLTIDPSATTPIPVRTWVPLSGTLQAPPPSTTFGTAIEIKFRTYDSPWVGTVYFDNLRIQ